jgi:hypothetical protein
VDDIAIRTNYRFYVQCAIGRDEGEGGSVDD